MRLTFEHERQAFRQPARSEPVAAEACGACRRAAARVSPSTTTTWEAPSQIGAGLGCHFRIQLETVRRKTVRRTSAKIKEGLCPAALAQAKPSALAKANKYVDMSAGALADHFITNDPADDDPDSHSHDFVAHLASTACWAQLDGKLHARLSVMLT
ncbi:MAG: hypothetical protein U0787_11810 [Polyangia bacterium]